MTASAPPPPETDDQAPAPAAAPRALIERQLWVLGRLAEAGLSVALAIEQQATAAAAPPAPGRVVQGDVALAYARAARAVRLTVALQGRLIKDLQALDEAAARVKRGAQVEAERARQVQATARKERVERIVARVIRAELGDEDADEDAVERLAEAAWERLDHDEIYGDLLAQPVGAIIDRLCRDLGLAPDWPRLAEEAWAREEIAGGAAGSPFLALSWPESRTGPPQTRPGTRSDTRSDTPPGTPGGRAAAAAPPAARPQAASP